VAPDQPRSEGHVHIEHAVERNVNSRNTIPIGKVQIDTTGRRRTALTYGAFQLAWAAVPLRQQAHPTAGQMPDAAQVRARQRFIDPHVVHVKTLGGADHADVGRP